MDRIVLRNIRASGHHGVAEDERATAQPIEVDVELRLDLGPAGRTDDLTRTIDYSTVDTIVRDVVERESFHLLEAIAERISDRILAELPVDRIVVRVRKPTVRMGGPIDFSGVEIRRRRPVPGADPAS